MIRALIFDFDGLIIDSEKAISATWVELYARYGLPFPEHLFRRMVGTREYDNLLWNDLAEQTGLGLDLGILEPARRARGVELANRLRPLPGVITQLDAAVGAGLTLAVASSSSRWWVDGHLERLGLVRRFTAVCTRELAARSKPDPGVYLAALRLLGVTESEAVAFEDSQAGIAAAKAAGMRAVAVPGSFTEHMDFSEADVVLASLADVTLAELMQRLEQP